MWTFNGNHKMNDISDPSISVEYVSSISASDNIIVSSDNLTPHVGWRADGAFKELTRQMIACLTAYFAGEDYNVVVSER